MHRLRTALLLATFVHLSTGTAVAQLRSALEPGSLGFGKPGVRAGFNASLDPPTGIVMAEAVVGLGRLDAGVGIGWSRDYGLDFAQEDRPALVLPSVAAQGLIHEWNDAARFGARFGAQLDVNDALSDAGTAVALARVSLGGVALRFVGDVSLASIFRDAGAPYLVPGAAVGVEAVGEHIGIYLLGGAYLWLGSSDGTLPDSTVAPSLSLALLAH